MAALTFLQRMTSGRFWARSHPSSAHWRVTRGSTCSHLKRLTKVRVARWWSGISKSTWKAQKEMTMACTAQSHGSKSLGRACIKWWETSLWTSFHQTQYQHQRRPPRLSQTCPLIKIYTSKSHWTNSWALLKCKTRLRKLFVPRERHQNFSFQMKHRRTSWTLLQE